MQKALSRYKNKSKGRSILIPPFIDAAAHCWYKRLPVTISVHTRQNESAFVPGVIRRIMLSW